MRVVFQQDRSPGVQEMSTYYLRVAGVNLAGFVYDTKDLSTIRGGGLLLLEAPDRVGREFGCLRPIATGASEGVFEFSAGNADEAARLARDVDRYLKNDPQLRHATFVVDVTGAAGGESWEAVRERLLALNRWRQQRAPSVSVPGVIGGSTSACALNRVRPADSANPIVRGGQGLAVCASVRSRREYGQDQKRRAFYESLTGRSFPGGFSSDFESIATDPSRGNLDRKMAVIYLDGNRFGRLQSSICDNPARQNEFDTAIKGLRRELLSQILERMAARPGFFEGGKVGAGRLRLETLLWGGDEIIWVVPAWQGWWMLATFYELSRDWRSIADASGKQQPLRHAAGLVFCHHSAPIHRITTLARDLAERAKCDRDRNLFACQALESYDHTGVDLDEFRARGCPNGVGPEQLILDGGLMADVLREFQAVKAAFPRRRLHAIVRSLLLPALPAMGLPGGRRPVIADTDELIRKAHCDLDEPTRAALESVVANLGGTPIGWVQLAHLWDYLVWE